MTIRSATTRRRPAQRATVRTRTARPTVRTFTVREDSFNDAERSVDAVLATDNEVTAFDLDSWKPVNEILVMRGWIPCEQAVVVDTHPQKQNGHIRSVDVHGSARKLRVDGGRLLGRLYFADDPASLALWSKVRARHVRDLSVGTAPVEQVEIPAGQSADVDGVTYTAGQTNLLVTTAWELGEVSVCPHGADPNAKIRQSSTSRIPGNSPMLKMQISKTLRQFLVKKGLRARASQATALRFLREMSEEELREMTEDERTEAEALREENPDDESTTRSNPEMEELREGEDEDDTVREGDDDEQVREGDDEEETTRSQTRSRNARRTNVRSGGARERRTSPSPTNLRSVVRRAVADTLTEERTRVRSIEDLAGDDVPEALRIRAVNDGWSVDRASTEFLKAIRSGRGPAGETERAPAIHTRSREKNRTTRSLGMAMMLRQGLDPIRNYREFDGGAHRPVREIDKDPNYLRAADDAWQYRDWSLVDYCREAVRLDGRREPSSRGELIREALSGSSLEAMFTTNVSAELMAGFEDATDTTVGWCSESDVPNFQTNERAKMGKFGALTKHKRGGTAEHLGTEDAKEEYRIARYSGKFVLDEMDIIDDRFGALEQVSPKDMGDTARQLRPNLVYAILLRNQALADGVALFHNATHKNIGSGVLNAANLQALITLLSKQRQKKRPLNQRARFLLVPQDLMFTADILLTSAERVIAADSGGTKNPLSALGITLRADDRLGVAGVVDPVDDTAVAGTATQYFVTARPGENGAKTIEVGYRRGTGRAPMLRSFQLDKGQWGIGWDINFDIGAKALAHESMAMSPGT